MIKLGIVYSNLLSPYFAGGGSLHAYEVVMRLRKFFDIVYYPSSLSFKWNTDILTQKANELERQGIIIADGFYSILDDISKNKLSINNMKMILKEKKIINKLIEKYSSDVDIFYEPDHTSPDIFYFGKAFNKKFGFTIHEPLFYADSFRYLRRLLKFYKINPYTGKGFYTRFLYNELLAKPKYKRLLKTSKPTFIASVSQGSLETSHLDGEVIRPGNAFDSNLLSYRDKGKEDYVIFWSRLNQDKGILEIPQILKIMEYNLHKKIKLKLMGKFFDKYNEKRFWNKVKKLNLDVEYYGFVEREKLNEIVSKAKVLIYPSHVDGFSLVVLESLALGTPVVGYDIPAIKSVYSNLEMIKIVREFDKNSMAIEASKLYSTSEKELNTLINNEKVLDFLRLHSSWDNVAIAVKNIINKYLE
ncbi:glycosyltransferase family 4 protein [Sulfuracidifex metallicus]|uniref:glycosyltransferase family 4 protein n=1 Tax=Sulfuracidifex metallicus TaxID=47303 RepID=UPI002276D8F0|nr:glycosyltransferase [Sulfuracidifex metallicus]MCY0850144.1 glycosyltransferase [Sulfuracidifex metallicus]